MHGVGRASLLLCLIPLTAASLAWKCGPLAQGDGCSGGALRCHAGTYQACISCCNAVGRAGCCSWHGNHSAEATPTTTPSRTPTETLTRTPHTPPTPTLTTTPTVNVTEEAKEQCFFHPDGTAHPLGGQQDEVWSAVCTSYTATETTSATISATQTKPIPYPSDTCRGSSIHPSRVAVGTNFTLTLYCRGGVAGEEIFLTRTVGVCDPDASVLLGPLSVERVRGEAADRNGHPVYAVPAVYEEGAFQVCLVPRTGGTFAIPTVVEVRGASVDPFVRLSRGAAGGTPFEISVPGFALHHARFAVSDDARCGNLLSFGSYTVDEDGRGATATQLLPAGRYWSCFSPFEDEDWQAHAPFVLPAPSVDRVVTTPRVLYTARRFVLTVFGKGLVNQSAPCGVARHGNVCPEVLAASSEMVEDTLACIFPEGLPLPGKYEVCVGNVNRSAVDPYGNTFDVLPGPDTSLKVIGYRSNPSTGEALYTRQWLVAVVRGLLPHNAYFRIADDVACTNRTQGTADGTLTPWVGPLLMAFSCPTPSAPALELLPPRLPKAPRLRVHLCRMEQYPYPDPPLVLCAGTGTHVSGVGVHTHTRRECEALGGEFHQDVSLCTVALCTATVGPDCPGRECSMTGGIAVMPIGGCLEHRIASIAVAASDSACRANGGRRSAGGKCWMEACPLSDLPVRSSRHYAPIAVTSPFVLSAPQFPVHLCSSPQPHTTWSWLGAFGVTESCEVAKAKHCRRIWCGEDYRGPGPCTMVGVEGRVLDTSGTGGYKAGPEPSSRAGVVWDGEIRGDSRSIQRLCQAVVCAGLSGSDPSPLDPFPARFAHSSSHRYFVPSPNGLQALFLVPPGVHPLPGEEFPLLSAHPLRLHHDTEATVGFKVDGLPISAVSIGLVPNTTYHNTTETPPDFLTSLDKCWWDAGTPLRLLARMHPPEISVWGPGPASCFIRRPGVVTEPLLDTVYHVLFVISWKPTMSVTLGEAGITVFP